MKEVNKMTKIRFTRYKKFIDEGLRNDKYYDKIKDKPQQVARVKSRLTKQWIEEVTVLGKQGYVIPWEIANDLWNLDTESSNNYVYRLTHDNPTIKIDLKWTRPAKGQYAKGWTKRAKEFPYGI